MNRKWISIFLVLAFATGLCVVKTAHAASTTLIIERFSYQSTPSEYVKIKNISGAPINLSSYRIGDEELRTSTEGMYFLPNINLAVGSSIIIATDADGWTFGGLPDYSFAANALGVPILTPDPTWASGTFALSNTGDEIIIIDNLNLQVDGVCYGTSTCNFNATGANTILTSGPLADLVSTEAGYRRNSDIDTDTTSDWTNNPTAITLRNFTAQANSASWALPAAALALLAGGGLWLRRRARRS